MVFWQVPAGCKRLISMWNGLANGSLPDALLGFVGDWDAEGYALVVVDFGSRGEIEVG